MSTPNFKKQSLFDLYATNDFVQYQYILDDNGDYILDENGDYLIDYDDEPCFDDLLFNECKEYADKLNARLDFFNIDFVDGYWEGIQTYINPQTSDLFAEFGVNSYILKRQILAEIKHINNDLLPELADMYNFDKLHIVAQFSNGETIYAKENN